MASLQDIRILFLDVDGVLTDNSIFVAHDGTHLKRFSIRDGLGIKLAQEAGLRIAIISGHGSPATQRRFEGLGVADIHLGVSDKRVPFQEVLSRLELTPSAAAVMGDDLVDLPLLRAAGFAATVPDAPDEVKAACAFVSSKPGGSGAVREVLEHILRAQGHWRAIVERFQQ